MAGKKALQFDEEKQFYTELGLLLQTYRKKMGLSQREIAQEVNVTFQQIQKYESAGNRVPVFVLHKMAKKFGVSFANIIGQDIERCDYRILEKKQIEKLLLDIIRNVLAVAELLEIKKPGKKRR